MSDLDPSSISSNRLRRRSFFENMDPDPSSSAPLMDTIQLHETGELSGGASSSTSVLPSGNSSVVEPSSSASSPLLSSTMVSDRALDLDGEGDGGGGGGGGASHIHPHGGPWSPRSLLGLLTNQLWYIQAWFIVKWQALEVNSRLARTLRSRIGRRGGAGGAGGGADSTTETLVVKQYAYPTHWIKLACASLVLLQCVLYQYFQLHPLDLHVEECIFHEKMMPALPARERILAGGAAAMASASVTSNSAAMRFLERRFELQHAPALLAQHNSNPRLPWTCMSIVPTLSSTSVAGKADSDDAVAMASQVVKRQAQQLALVLPRSQVVQADATHAVTSRLHLALGSAMGAPIERGSSSATGVLAALFPLATFKAGLFPSGFPDLILVKSEYALKRMVLYRHERHEEFQHRIDQRDEEGGVGEGGAVPGGGGEQVGGGEQEEEGGEPKMPEDADPKPIRTSEQERKLQEQKSRTQFGVFLMKTTVPDIYDRHIVKNWNSFLHVVVVGEQDKQEQFTKEILTLWLHHPEWPVLHVRFQQSLTLCGSYQRFLSTIRQVTGDDAEIVNHTGSQLPRNLDLSCDPVDNTRREILKLKNEIGIHLFPVPPEMEVYEELALESASAGAVVVTYNTPIMREWIPDSCGVRVGSYENTLLGADPATALLELPEVRVTSGEIERAVEGLLVLDGVHRVAAGRAARIQYLKIRTHFLSAVAALDTAICDFDNDETLDQQNEIGQRSRKKVDIDMIRVFLY